VKLVSDLLEKTFQATEASYEQSLVELDSARRDVDRAEKLHVEKLIADKTYDDFRFRLEGLEKKTIALNAEVERMELELKKKTVTAPFNGIIIKQHVDRGEWLSTGSPVATVAKADVVDVIVGVPGDMLPYIKESMNVRVFAGGKNVTGKVFTVIPRGDIETRTFPVKIRINNTYSLIEGMEAKVLLPTGRAQKSLTVSRDAIVRKSGQTFIYIIADEQARMIPVRVTGYSGGTAGVTAEGLAEGMNVVIKGNERLMNGQPVKILNGQGKK
jgi:RND family efflux transporter MFP subunit